MGFTVVRSCGSMRCDNISNSPTVDKAVEYILAQPDGKVISPLNTIEANLLLAH